jgi:hypothetical protein
MRLGGQRHSPDALLGTHWTGGWVGPRAGLDWCGRPRFHRDSISGPPRPQRVAIPTVGVPYLVDFVLRYAWETQGNVSNFSYIQPHWSTIKFASLRHMPLIKFYKQADSKRNKPQVTLLEILRVRVYTTRNTYPFQWQQQRGAKSSLKN